MISERNRHQPHCRFCDEAGRVGAGLKAAPYSEAWRCQWDQSCAMPLVGGEVTDAYGLEDAREYLRGYLGAFAKGGGLLPALAGTVGQGCESGTPL